MRAAVGGQCGPMETKQRVPWTERATSRYGIVLVLLLATFMFLAAGFTSPWARLLTVALQALTLLAAVAAAQVPLRLQWLARLVALLSVAAASAAIQLGGRTGNTASAVLSGALVAFAPIAIATSIVRRRIVDARTVLAALCIYVLLGLLWAFVYTTIGTAGTQPFFAEHTHATTSDYVYFSFITLTTVGYGDLTAAGDLGRACAALEALVGQVYLVTVVALLVSNLGRGREPQRR
jgi:voltage-gated potassium channel